MRARRLVTLFVLGVVGLSSGVSPAQAAGPPEVFATWVAGVTATSATLGTLINPNGLPTRYRFEYVTEQAFQESGFSTAVAVPPGAEASAGAGTVAQELSQLLGGLKAATAYRYRARATNSAGTDTGPEHVLTTQESTLLFSLPDGRHWELVSPADKGGGSIQGPEESFGGGLDQAAVSGSSLTYSATPAFAEASGAPPASQYLSTRTESGWITRNLSPGLQSGVYRDHPDGVPFRLFAADLSLAVLFGGDPCRGTAGCPNPAPPLPGSGAPPAYPDYYLRQDSNGAFSALVTAIELAHSTVSAEHFQLEAVASTPSLSHVILSTCAALSPEATEVSLGVGECDPDATNLYEWSVAGLRLVNLLPGETSGSPGASIAASLGAVSTDGDRIYFTTPGDGYLYLRDGAATQLVSEDGEFQTASADGSTAYFTRLGHLYRYRVATHSADDLTPAGGVSGVLGASADGSYVYFQDGSGLRRWHEGVTTEIVAGSSAVTADSYPPDRGTARVSADGTHLAFLSAAQLTDYDNAGRAEAYLYGPLSSGGPPVLACVSCNTTGERPEGAASIPGAPLNGSSSSPYKPRALSLNGRRLFFESEDDLVPQDTDGQRDVYEWETVGEGDCARSPGCVRLISSGRATEGARFLDASADGADAYFLTNGSLVGADKGSVDVYDARVGSGFAEAPAPIPCNGDACQALPHPPDDPSPGTLLQGPSNPATHFPKQRQRRQKKFRRHKHGKHHHRSRRGGR